MGETRTLEMALASLRRTGRRPLALEEVVASGRPAIYARYGDVLLFMDGTIFDLHEAYARNELPSGSPANGPATVDQAVGIEFGWRHAWDCPCALCRPQGLAA
jgi:hypothetical protein